VTADQQHREGAATALGRVTPISAAAPGAAATAAAARAVTRVRAAAAAAATAAAAIPAVRGGLRRPRRPDQRDTVGLVDDALGAATLRIAPMCAASAVAAR
jgi:hypothetical protein